MRPNGAIPSSPHLKPFLQWPYFHPLASASHPNTCIHTLTLNGPVSFSHRPRNPEWFASSVGSTIFLFFCPDFQQWSLLPNLYKARTLTSMSAAGTLQSGVPDAPRWHCPEEGPPPLLLGGGGALVHPGAGLHGLGNWLSGLLLAHVPGSVPLQSVFHAAFKCSF